MITRIVFLRYNGEILKLNVSYDTDELTRIKKDMIDNCSVIKKVRDKHEIFYKSCNDYNDNEHYKNLKIDVLSYPHRDESREDVWIAGERLVSYDYYCHPNLAVQIGNVIRGVFGGSNGFMISFQEINEKASVTEEITKSMQDILDDKSISEETRIKELGKLSNKLNEISTGKVIYPVHCESSYNHEILSTMSVEVIMRIDETILGEFINFFDITMQDESKSIIDFNSLDEILKAYLKPMLTKQNINDENLKQLIPDNN